MRKSTLEIVPHVYQLTIGGANVILIAEDNLTLVDTGFRNTSAQVINFIQGLGRSVEEIGLIVITHNHFDHVGGLARLRELTAVKVAVHEADIGDTNGQAPYPPLMQKLLRIMPFPAFRSAFSVRPEEVDVPLVGGEILEPLGGLEVIHTPGHTPGSISLYSSRYKLLMVGDALNAGRKKIRLPVKMVNTDQRQAIDSIKKIAQLDFNILCCGHGRPLTGDVRIRVQDLIENIKD